MNTKINHLVSSCHKVSVPNERFARAASVSRYIHTMCPMTQSYNEFKYVLSILNIVTQNPWVSFIQFDSFIYSFIRILMSVPFPRIRMCLSKIIKTIQVYAISTITYYDQIKLLHLFAVLLLFQRTFSMQ